MSAALPACRDAPHPDAAAASATLLAKASRLLNIREGVPRDTRPDRILPPKLPDLSVPTPRGATRKLAANSARLHPISPAYGRSCRRRDEVSPPVWVGDGFQRSDPAGGWLL